MTEHEQPYEPGKFEHEHAAAESLYAAFYWLLETEEFADGPADDESRALEIGNVYTYALEEGVEYDLIEEIYETARLQLEHDDEKGSHEEAVN